MQAVRMHRRIAGGTVLALWAAAAHAAANAPLVRSYGQSLPEPKLTRLESAAVEALRRAQGDAASLTVDPALCLAARAHAAQFASDETPRAFAFGKGSVRYWMDAAGVSVVDARAGCARVAEDATGEQILKALKPSVSPKGMNIVGAGAGRKGGKTVVTVIAARRRIVFDPFPMTPAPGRTYRLKGRLTAGLRGWKVLLTDPSGRLRRLADGESPYLDAAVPLLCGRGRYVVEVLADAAEGLVETDVFKLYAGVAFPRPFTPTSAKRAARAPASTVQTPTQMAEALIKQINKLRMESAMLPLRRDPKLMRIALYNSQDLARRRSAKPDSRLAQIFVRSQVRCRTCGVAPYVGTKPPPAGRIKLAFNAAFTHVGVGVAQGELEGKRVVWVTVILVER